MTNKIEIEKCIIKITIRMSETLDLYNLKRHC